VDLATLIALETQVWDALVRGDAAADRALLADEFLGVYPTGFADRAAHAEQVDGGPSVARFEISEARLCELSPACVLLAYRAEYSRPTDPARTEAMYITSIWCRHGDRWSNVFSQDTPAVPGRRG
jgi:hypothetical protein